MYQRDLKRLLLLQNEKKAHRACYPLQRYLCVLKIAEHKVIFVTFECFNRPTISSYWLKNCDLILHTLELPGTQ